ncbi:MgtC family membrane protein [Caballeronia catudaia]|uniref:MgtC family membrane protein n=1 Tax=Caballeronia catudaia TaxID=1777136 RepID=A0A158C7B3_9BURK|nr:hypothetical protein [Caballeronia catudaia]SAK77417.1 MgtC family membrane protein [Caballeronia catudaia]
MIVSAFGFADALTASHVDSADLDEVRVELSRASAPEYQAICERLRQLDVVREFREDDVS